MDIGASKRASVMRQEGWEALSLKATETRTVQSHETQTKTRLPMGAALSCDAKRSTPDDFAPSEFEEEVVDNDFAVNRGCRK
jgi:hypothetical protein